MKLMRVSRWSRVAAAIVLAGGAMAALFAATLAARPPLREPIAGGEAAAAQFADLTALRCSDRNQPGVGLQADYFAGQSQRGGLLISRIEPTVEFDPLTDWSARMGRPRSVRWQGWIKAPLKGRYRFHAVPAGTIVVAGQVVAGHGADAQAGLDLEPGHFYPIEFRTDLSVGAGAGARLEWTAPHGVRYVVPRALLFPPSPKAAT